MQHVSIGYVAGRGSFQKTVVKFFDCVQDRIHLLTNFSPIF